MAIEVFWSSGSAYSWRVLLTLEAKGLAYESHVLQFSQAQHRTPEYLALNPRGRVPTLRDGDVVVYDSIAIMAYLDRKHPAPPLFGATPAETGRIWRVISEAMSYLDTPTEDFILPSTPARPPRVTRRARSAPPCRASTTSSGAWRPRCARPPGWRPPRCRPPTSRSSRWSNQSCAPPESRARPAFEPRLLPFPERYPSIARWLERVEALPGYERTYPPHWR